MTYNTRELILAAVIYTGFFGAIVAAMIVAGHAWPLFALILTPSVNISGDDSDKTK